MNTIKATCVNHCDYEEVVDLSELGSGRWPICPIHRVNLYIGSGVTQLGKPTKRKNEGKPPVSEFLRFPVAIAGAADVMRAGREKYGNDEIWRNYEPVEVVDSLLRHLTKYMNGGLKDEESGKEEVFHILCNALMLAEITGSAGSGKGTEPRPYPAKQKTQTQP